MHPFTAAFLLALALAEGTRLWLAGRQVRHVAAHRAEVPADFSGSISLASHQKAADYTIARTRAGIVEGIIAAALLLAFTLGGALQALSDLWGRMLEPGSQAQGVALIASVAVISTVVDLPLALYRTFVIEAKFDFNRMTPGMFFTDLAKQTALAALIGIPVLFLVLWLMSRMGTLWWLYVWLFWVAFNAVVLLIYPTVIAPWFNKFSPLEDATLKARIEALLARCGFRARGLFVMDGSRRSSHGNAYFTGFGMAKRIVLFDTLLARLAPPEIEAVLAHELGHFTHHHVLKRLAFLFAASLGLLWLLGWLIAQDWFYAGLGVRSHGNAMALLLFMLVVPVFMFPLQPLASFYSRRHEYQADSYATQHAQAGDLVRALAKLYQDNASTLTPDPLHSAFYDSHPPASLRIARLQNLYS